MPIHEAKKYENQKHGKTQWCVFVGNIPDLTLGLFDTQEGADAKAREMNNRELESAPSSAPAIQNSLAQTVAVPRQAEPDALQLLSIEDWIKANQDRTESTVVDGVGAIEYVAPDGRGIQKRNRGKEFAVLSAPKPYEVGQFATVNKNREVLIHNVEQVRGVGK